MNTMCNSATITSLTNFTAVSVINLKISCSICKVRISYCITLATVTHTKTHSVPVVRVCD